MSFDGSFNCKKNGGDAGAAGPWCSDAADVWRGSDQAVDAAACGDWLGKSDFTEGMHGPEGTHHVGYADSVAPARPPAARLSPAQRRASG
jgi:hypothetical protein